MLNKSFLIRFYRIDDWIKVLGIPILALLLSGSFQPTFYILSISSCFLAFAHTFSINSFYDYTETKENNFIGQQIKKNKLSNKKTLILVFLPLVPLFLLFSFMNFLSVILMSSLIILFDMYSCPPFRLKRYPTDIILSPLCLIALPFFSTYFLVSTHIAPKAIFVFIAFFLYDAFSSILHQLAHRNADRKNDFKTIPNIFGIPKSIMTGKIIIITTILVSLMGIAANQKENYILFGTVIINLLRYRKISSPEINFEELRNHVFGLEEGTYYLILLFLQNLVI